MNLQLHTKTSLPSATMIIVKPRQVVVYISDLTKWTLTEAHHISLKHQKHFEFTMKGSVFTHYQHYSARLHLSQLQESLN